MTITNNPYAELQDVKDAMALKAATSDAWIGELLVQAQTRIDRYVGYSFQSEGTVDAPVSKIFSGQGTGFLYVPYIQSISSVTQNASSYDFWVSSGTMDLTSDCYIGPDNTSPGWEVHRISSDFNRGRNNYTVSGVWGFTEVPDDISRACTRIAIHWYLMRNTNYADTLNEQGSIRQKYNKQLPIDVVEILNDYKTTNFYSHD